MPKINDIVLVHGGFVDGAGWRGVVSVVQNPWKSKPSWYLQVGDDKMIPYPAQQFTAQRAGATVVEVPGSHAIYVSNPKAVADLIEQAASGIK
jgi:pimeloyl-ACP methyl ester carboxylesterase